MISGGPFLSRPLLFSADCINILEDFARDFPGGFFGHFFPRKRGEKISRQNKNLAAQKQKSAKNPFCQKPTLKEGLFHTITREFAIVVKYFQQFSCDVLLCLMRSKSPTEPETLRSSKHRTSSKKLTLGFDLKVAKRQHKK